MVETRTGVTHAWAAKLPSQDVRRAAALRHTSDVRALWIADRLWLQGTQVADDPRDLLRLIPGVRPYLRAADGQLTVLGERVPSAQLPDGNWRPLTECLGLQLPRAQSAIPGRPIAQSLSLVRSNRECPTTLLLTTLDAWAGYVETAPQWRLDCLAFAADGRGSVLVRGTPSPPLRGTPWVERNGIATPAGWTWTPAVSSDQLRQLLGVRDGAIALLAPLDAGSATQQSAARLLAVIADSAWVRATRSAVRRTAGKAGAS